MKKKRNDKYGLAKVLAAIGVIALLGSAAAAASAWLKGLSRRMPVPKRDGKKVKRGFTLAEVLAVALIIIILTAVSFVGVIRYQRSMKLMEMDGIAKQVFIAAQNHLTLAKSQGYLGKSDGSKEDAEKGIYYFIVGSGKGTYSDPDAASDTLLSLMLPYASVDETVRKDGSYIIRYQNLQDVAQVLDVFYVDKGGRFGHTYGTDDYNPLMDPKGEASTKYWGTANKNNRLDYGGSIIGWYGGERGTAGSGPVETPPPVTKLVSPILKLHNEETLWAELLDPNVSVSGLQWNLVITGDSSGEKCTVKLTKSTPKGQYNQYTFTLDDIAGTLKTTDLPATLDNSSITGTAHFSTLFGTTLTPGENITLQATVDATEEYLTVVSSNVCHGNSLFGDNSFTEKAIPATSDKYYYETASIENFRHLENLDAEISCLDIAALNSKLTRPSKDPAKPAPVPVSFTEVRLEKNLDWVNSWFFKDENNEKKEITYAAKNGKGNPGCYLPVTPVTPANSRLTFDGNDKSIKRLIVNTDGMAGVFGTYEGGKIQNLTIQNPSIVSSGSAAGALAGKTIGTTVNNVVARNEDRSKSFTLSAMRAPEGSGSSYGGLPVLWARGLLGMTERGTEDTGSETTESYDLQIKGKTAAGGLIGSMEGGEANFCTAALYVRSAGDTSSTAGGFAGSVSGTVTLRGCYASAHTDAAKYGTEADQWNVRNLDGIAGALIGGYSSGGSSEGLKLECCYATCSATGAYAAGLIGSLTGKATVDTCYSTGLVVGTSSEDGKEDGFIRSAAGSIELLGSCRYMRLEKSAGDGYMSSVLDGNESLSSLLAEDLVNSGSFLVSLDKRQPADCYDDAIRVKYKSRYYFPTVEQLYAEKGAEALSRVLSDLGMTTPAAASKHIGDWYVPIPVPMTYEWINGDILALKIDFWEFAKKNKGKGPDTILVAVTGDTSKETRVYQLDIQWKNEDKTLYTYTVSNVGSLKTVTDSETGLTNVEYDWETGLPVPKLRVETNIIKSDDEEKKSDKKVLLVFDDITDEYTVAENPKPTTSFYNLMCGGGTAELIPGENLTAMVSTLPTWKEMEDEYKELLPKDAGNTRTNSLFGYNGTYNPVAKVVQKNDSGTVTGSVIQGKAEITSIRHLENLNGKDSHYGEGLDSYHTSGAATGDTLEAYQTNNLSWSGFTTTTNKEDCIGNSDYPYKPVDTAYKLKYKGEYTDTSDAETVKKAYSITGIPVGISVTVENAGIFGTLDSDDSVTGLELVDIAATGSDSAGALAGTSSGTVTGVLVRCTNTSQYDAKAISSVSGAAGGLIGSVTGGTVTKCAAAVKVQADGTDACAGGLVGSVEGGSISASYSGGRTTNGKYSAYNVTAASGTAGGLIGSYGPQTGSGSKVEYCYSTCSVQGNTAGGLAGKASGGTVDHCYCTGLVGGNGESPVVGAFAGINSSNVTNCKYYRIINETLHDNDHATYLDPLPAGSHPGIAAIDASVSAYDEFIGKDRKTAVPYDALGDEYGLVTVAQLGAGVADTDLVAVHYGDWPTPEAWAVNK